MWCIVLIKSPYWRKYTNVLRMNVRQSNCLNLSLHHHIISFSPSQWIIWDFWLVKLPSNWLVLPVVMPLDLGCLLILIYLVGSSFLCWWCILLIFFGLNLHVQSQGEDEGLNVDYFTFSPNIAGSLSLQTWWLVMQVNWYFRSFEVITTVSQFYCIKSLVFHIAIIVVKDA